MTSGSKVKRIGALVVTTGALAMVPAAAHAETPAQCWERERLAMVAHFDSIEEAGWGSPHYALVRGLAHMAACYA